MGGISAIISNARRHEVEKKMELRKMKNGKWILMMRIGYVKDKMNKNAVAGYPLRWVRD